MKPIASSISGGSRSNIPVSRSTSPASSTTERMSLLRQKEDQYTYDSLPFTLADERSRFKGVTSRLYKGWVFLKKVVLWCRKFKIIELLPSFFVGAMIWFLVEPFEDISETSVHVLAVFTSTIIALLTSSYDISVIVLLSLAILSLTRSFFCETTDGLSVECSLCGQPKPSQSSFEDDVYDCDGYRSSFLQALAGYSNEVNWLVVAAFHLGHAVEITLLGKRLSLEIIKKMSGVGVLGLGYAIVASELLLGPFVPSNTARGGGIVKPIATSIARALDSMPKRNPAIGRFLMLVGAHANLISASFYLTAMAANPLIIAKAHAIYPDLKFGFLTWLEGASIPGLVTIGIVPLVLWDICLRNSTESYDKDAMFKHAEAELRSLGRVSRKEKQLCLILLTCLSLWVTASWTMLDPTLIAFCATIILVLTDTVSWNDIVTNHKAWDTFIWLGGLLTLASALSTAGVSHFLGRHLSYFVSLFTTDLLISAVILAFLYFLSAFFFGSLSAHVVAFGSVFLSCGYEIGVPARVFVALLAYFSSLSGVMTNFSTGTVAMYFSEGYSTSTQWFTIGILISIIHLTVYLTIGIGWWMVLGWY